MIGKEAELSGGLDLPFLPLRQHGWRAARSRRGQSSALESRIGAQLFNRFGICGSCLRRAPMTAGLLRSSAFLRWQALILLTLNIGNVLRFDASHFTAAIAWRAFLGWERCCSLWALSISASVASQKFAA